MNESRDSLRQNERVKGVIKESRESLRQNQRVKGARASLALVVERHEEADHPG